MGHTLKILDSIRTEIAPTDETLAEARARRDAVLTAARGFDGRLRDYNAGSIGHRTANNDTDADCGVVLDRRTYPKLGPDGDGEGPTDVVAKMQTHVREDLKKAYPHITTSLSKRAITFAFHAPIGIGDQAPDPTVDLIVALNRKEDDALWIPNREKDAWDASHPEYHTRVLTDPPDDVRRARARVIRVVKAWNQQPGKASLCSFNIEALALEVIVEAVALDEGLMTWFEYAVKSLKKGKTEDPAGVSAPINLPLELDVVVGRLERAAAHMRRALDNDSDDNVVIEELAAVFPKYVEKPSGDTSKAAMAAALRGGNSSFNRAGAFVGGAVGVATTPLKTTRSFGDGKVR
jgi:hypothetical protein